MEHTDPVEAFFARAKDAGVNMSEICTEAGVAQSTPSRWKSDSNSANLATVRKLDEALSHIIESRREAA